MSWGSHADQNAIDFGLLASWKAGDQAAAQQLMRRHYGSVRRFFDMRATHAADDLTQATFLASVEGLTEFRGDATFKAYLFGIARHQLLRHLRKEGRRENAMRFAASGGANTKTSLSVVAARKEEQHLLLMAISQLPTDLQVAVELYYWEGMPTAEIGSVLETNASTVTSRLARARELIRQHVYDMTRPGPIRDSLIGDIEGWSRSLAEPTRAANDVGR